MATTPISPPASAPAAMQSAANPASLTPFVRIQQRDRHEDIPACLAMLTSKSLDEVFKAMESSGLPKTGPYHGYITETIICGVLIKSNLIATVWKESAAWLDIPDVAIVMVDYNFEYELGRCVVFHRVKDATGKQVSQCVIDPYAGAALVTTDLKQLAPSWYIGIHKGGKPAV